MLYGAALRPPSLEAKLVDLEPGNAASMPGVVKVVIEAGFAGVVAKSREQAVAARDALDAKWDAGHPWQQEELEALVTVGGPRGACIQRKGSARSVLERGASLTAEYRTALVAHASLETLSALAEIGPRGGKVWTSTQAETFTAGLVSKALGFKKSQIEVVPTLLGGGFGRKAINNNVSSAAVEAAILSRSAGAPVHVAWDRSEEMRHGFVRPMTHHRISARLRDGLIEAIRWQEASGDSLLGTMPAQELMARLVGFDLGAVNGAWIRYSIPNLETTAWRRRLPLPAGPWRGLGLAANTFALEAFIDEAAEAAGKDPVQFRLDHLADDRESRRLGAVVEAAAEGAGWGGGTLPEGHARGIACCVYHGTHVAEVAEVSLDEPSGSIRVHDVVAAIDCGRAINPDQVRSQVEGCVVMGTSVALLEEITVRDGRVTAGDFGEYPILRLDQAPRVKTVVVEPPGGKPSGCGEPPIGPIAPAIANAFFALTRRRLRELPLSPARVLAAVRS